MRITGAVVESKGAPFVLMELDLGALRDDEVLVEIAASGVCHTDLICRDQWYPVPLPTVPAGVVGAPAFGTVEGESTPSDFVPRLVDLWRRGAFPVERIMSFYDFDQIDQPANDAEAGRVIKPVLRIG